MSLSLFTENLPEKKVEPDNAGKAQGGLQKFGAPQSGGGLQRFGSSGDGNHHPSGASIGAQTDGTTKIGLAKFSSALDKKSTEFAKKKNITKPYQFFGVWIAQNLGDFTHIALYIRLAKFQDRGLLEQAVSYIKDYPDAQSKHRLFMWYLKGKLRPMPRAIKKKKTIIKQPELFGK